MRIAYILCLSLLASAACAQTYQEKIIASVLAAEAASEGLKGMTAVAEVIHQRSSSKNKTPFQVVTSGKGRTHAFSCLNGTTPDRLCKKQSKRSSYAEAMKVALVLSREPEKLPNTTKHATHYTRKEEKPYWSKGHQPVAIIGAHAFYRLSD